MRDYTCIICPNGCEITPEREGDSWTFVGALCARGEAYVLQEMSDPRRTISSLVRVEGGVRPLVSARITKPVPRDRIGDVMRLVRSLSCRAPVRAGQVLATDLPGGSDLIATDDVAASV